MVAGNAAWVAPRPPGAVVPSLEARNRPCLLGRLRQSVGLGPGPSISMLATTEATVPGLKRRCRPAQNPSADCSRPKAMAQVCLRRVGLGPGPSISVLAATETTVSGLNRREWGKVWVGERSGEWVEGRSGRQGVGGLQATGRALSPAFFPSHQHHEDGAVARQWCHRPVTSAGLSAGLGRLRRPLGARPQPWSPWSCHPESSWPARRGQRRTRRPGPGPPTPSGHR